MRVGAYKAHLVTQQPNEPHAGPEHGFLERSRSSHEPYGVQDPWLLFNVEVRGTAWGTARGGIWGGHCCAVRGTRWTRQKSIR